MICALKVTILVIFLIKSSYGSKMLLDIPEGTSLEFDYISEVKTGPADSKYGSSFKLNASIYLWKYDANHMRVFIKNATSTREEDNGQTHLKHGSVNVDNFNFLIGHDEEMEFIEIQISKDPPYPINFLTSLVNLFQIDRNVFPSKQPETVDFKTGAENTIYGNCTIDYQIKPGKNHTFLLEKSFNPEKCTEFKSKLFSTVELVNNDCWDKERDSIFQIDNRRIYKFDALPNIHVKNIEAIQTILFHPFQENGLIFATKINQTITLIKSHPEIPKEVEVVKPYDWSNRNFHYTDPLYFSKYFPTLKTDKFIRDNYWMPSIRQKVLTYLEETENYVRSKTKIESDVPDHLMSNLLDLMKTFEEDDFLNCYKELKEKENTTKLFLGISSSIGTEASLKFILHLYHNNQLKDEKVLMNLLILLGLNVRVPNIDLELWNFANNTSEDLRIVSSFTLSNIMDKIKTNDVDYKMALDTVGLLETADNYQEQILLIQMLGNLWKPIAVPLLTNIANGEQVLLKPFDENLVVEAMMALEKILKNDKDQLFKILFPILANKNQIREVRGVALKIIMYNLNDKENGNNLFQLMQQETDPDIYNFYKSSLDDFNSHCQCNAAVSQYSQIWKATTKSKLPIGLSMSYSFERFNRKIGTGLYLRGVALLYLGRMDIGVKFLTVDLIYYVSKMPIKFGTITLTTPFSRPDPEVQLTIEIGRKVVYFKIYHGTVFQFFMNLQSGIDIFNDEIYFANLLQVEYQIPTDVGTLLEFFGNIPYVLKSLLEIKYIPGTLGLNFKSASKVWMPQRWGMKIANPVDGANHGVVQTTSLNFNFPIDIKLSIEVVQFNAKYALELLRSSEEASNDVIGLKAKTTTSIYTFVHDSISHFDIGNENKQNTMLFEGTIRDLGLDYKVASSGRLSTFNKAKLMYSPIISEMSKVTIDKAILLADGALSELLFDPSALYTTFEAYLLPNQKLSFSKYTVSLRNYDIEGFTGTKDEEKCALKYSSKYDQNSRIFTLTRYEINQTMLSFCIKYHNEGSLKVRQNSMEIFIGKSNEEKCVFDQFKAQIYYSMSPLPNSKFEDFPQCIPNPYSKLFIQNPDISAIDCALALTNMRKLKAIITYNNIPEDYEEYLKTLANWLVLTFPARYEYSTKAVKNQVMVDLIYPPSFEDVIDLTIHTEVGSYVFEHYPAEKLPFNFHFRDLSNRRYGVEPIKDFDYKTKGEYDAKTDTWIYDRNFELSVKELDQNQLAFNITVEISNKKHFIYVYPGKGNSEKYLITTPPNNHNVLQDRMEIVPILIQNELIISIPSLSYNSILLFNGTTIKML